MIIRNWEIPVHEKNLATESRDNVTKIFFVQTSLTDRYFTHFLVLLYNDLSWDCRDDNKERDGAAYGVPGRAELWGAAGPPQLMGQVLHGTRTLPFREDLRVKNFLELVQHFRLYGESSHRLKSDACSKFDMVWLNLSPIPVGRRGIIIIFFSFRWFYLSSLHVEKGGGWEGVGALWEGHLQYTPKNIFKMKRIRMFKNPIDSHRINEEIVIGWWPVLPSGRMFGRITQQGPILIVRGRRTRFWAEYS